MSILTFAFTDGFRNWHLNEMSFSEFNLLVGVSGVGKTKILSSLHAVSRAAISSAKHVNGCEWHLRILAEGGTTFSWTAKTSLVPKTTHYFNFDDTDDDATTETPKFLTERIVRDDATIIVDRSESRFSFNDKDLPRLKDTESAITLLRDEPTILPLFKALSRFMFSEPVNAIEMFLPFEVAKRAREKHTTIESLKDSTRTPTLVKAFVLQEDYPEVFSRLKDDYRDIFPAVLDIRLDKFSAFEPSEDQSFSDWLSVGIQEKGIRGWITDRRLSSGMLRTLIHLFELSLAPNGTVVIIDEFENSLGVNCLRQVTDHILRRSKLLQFVLTSHHPYVINNVPPNRWKLVTRSGDTVTVRDAESIPALKTSSAHEKFLLLTNLPEFEGGVASE